MIISRNYFKEESDMKIKEDIDMKHLYKKKFHGCLILAVLLYGIAVATDTGKWRIISEKTVVTSLPGEKPGQYEYYVGSGHTLLPRCFAIDPNDGTFYIPEVHMGKKVHLHKFDKTGKFIDMLKLEGKAEHVYNIAVDLSGEIYLYCRVLYAGNYIIHYDKTGKLLNSFGPQGIITEKDWDKEDLNPSPGDERYRDKYFWKNFVYFSTVDGYLTTVYQEDQDVFTFYRFDGKTGQLLNRDAKVPGNIEEIMTGTPFHATKQRHFMFLRTIVQVQFLFIHISSLGFIPDFLLKLLKLLLGH